MELALLGQPFALIPFRFVHHLKSPRGIIGKEIKTRIKDQRRKIKSKEKRLMLIFVKMRVPDGFCNVKQVQIDFMRLLHMLEDLEARQ